MPACGSESASVGSFLVQSWTSVYGIINSDIVKGFKLQDKAYKDRELYEKLIRLYDGITDGKSDDEINQVLFTTVEWGTVCEGAGFSAADEPTLNYLSWIESVLKKHSFELPNKELVSDMTKDQKNGWGDFCNCRYLSIILNKR